MLSPQSSFEVTAKDPTSPFKGDLYGGGWREEFGFDINLPIGHQRNADPVAKTNMTKKTIFLAPAAENFRGSGEDNQPDGCQSPHRTFHKCPKVGKF